MSDAPPGSLGPCPDGKPVLSRPLSPPPPAAQLLRVQAPDLAPPLAPDAAAPPQAGRPKGNPHAMNVVMVGAECAPWSKTGASQGPGTGVGTRACGDGGREVHAVVTRRCDG